MARTRPEEDADVAGPGGPREPGLLIANGVVREQPRDFSRYSRGALVRVGAGDHPEHRAGAGLLDREPILVVVLEVIGPARMAADLGEQVVDEPEQLRHRSEAPRDRAAAARAGAQPRNECACFLQDRDLGVAEAI